MFDTGAMTSPTLYPETTLKAFRLTEQELEDYDQLMAKIKPISKIELPKVVKNVGYLDLASLPITKSQKGNSETANRIMTLLVSAGIELSTSSDLSAGNHIIVELGEMKLLNRMVLKRQGRANQFLLFPNLPVELRAKILEYGLPPRFIQGIEHYDPKAQTFQFKIFGERRPTICLVSKSAHNDLIEMKVYRQLFETNHHPKAVYFNPKVDFLLIDSNVFHQSEGAIVSPNGTFSNALINPGDLKWADNICMEFATFNNSIPWIKENISSMPFMKTLNLLARVFGAGGREVHQMMFTKIPKSQAYLPEYKYDHGTAYGNRAVEVFCSHLASAHMQSGWARLIHMFLGKLTEFPEDSGLPNIIVFSLYLVPFDIGEFMDSLQE